MHLQSHHHGLVWAITALLASRNAVADSTASICIASAQPSNGASNVISPSFAGFGIEMSNLYSFTGFDTANPLSINLLNNLANYTGTPPHMRIGGNTQDYILYNTSYSDFAIGVNPHPVGQGAYPTDLWYIGPKFFEALNRFTKNTPITWGLNLAYIESDYLDQLKTMASAVHSSLTKLNLVSFEIGNEPDLYLQNGFRSGSWSGDIYTQQWLPRASEVYAGVLEPLGLGSDFFETACTASTIGTSFQLADLVDYGISANGNHSSKPYVAAWNQHDYYYYIGVSPYSLTMSSFMDLSTTTSQFGAWETQVQQGHAAGFPYALREMGVVGPIGLDGITNVFAASLWTLNFFLYAATLNISSVQMHMTDNSYASAWLPVQMYGLSPYVRPNYYAWAAFDQTIGSSCSARVASLPLSSTPSGYTNHIGSYAVYQDDSLASIVLINTVIANTTTSPKPTLSVSLTLPSSLAGERLYLSYLTSDGADAKTGTTWNGISYEESDAQGGPTLVNGSVTYVEIGKNGKVVIPVRDTQAVVANLKKVVGTPNDPVIGTACSAFASATPDATPVGSTGLPISVTTASGVTISTATSSAGGETSAANRLSYGEGWSRGGVVALVVLVLGFVHGLGLIL